jgi:predicted dehydrogenase
VIKTAIVGAGLIGRKRAESLVSCGQGGWLAAVCDADPGRAEALATATGSIAYNDWQKVLEIPGLEVVIAAAPNKVNVEIAAAALEHGCHVLCEKPLGRNAGEAERLNRAAASRNKILKTGFNHRHHPALRKAKTLVEAGGLGPLYYVRGVYGHGGRPGYENEWRADPELAGGGVLLDQGVHIVDLSRWFLGEIREVYGQIRTAHWPMPVEDNASMILRADGGRTASLEVSWTQWKNKFQFEIFGEKGYLLIDGLGGSYGREKLVCGTRRADPEKPGWYLGGAPDEKVDDFPGPDISWDEEWKEFTGAILEGREPLGSGRDGLHAARIIDAVYRSARLNAPVPIE